MTKQGYVLGNLANEIKRLGFQHEVLSAGFRALWQRGGIGKGTEVLDAGCGPGYATLELADLVGDTGKVTALDFTPAYLQHLRAQLADSTHHNVEVVEGDVHSIPMPDASCDVIFTKFVLLFVADLGKVLGEFLRVLRPGGRLLISDYESAGRFAPPEHKLNEFLEFLQQHYHGRVDIEVGRILPKTLTAQGFQVNSIMPEVHIGRRGNRIWQWTDMFMQSTLDRVAEDGDLPLAKVDQYRAALAQLSTDPQIFYVSSLLLHIMATKSR